MVSMSFKSGSDSVLLLCCCSLAQTAAQVVERDAEEPTFLQTIAVFFDDETQGRRA